mmetsp:Transcript_30775/g.67501  ORF Transcript_30775/g.67501 Transcript_30775/m.67501 type:complete len:185 (+) Transcript_30775:63-617(+)
MGKSAAICPTLVQKMHQYQIVGRAQPTKKQPEPKIYRMKLFAKNKVIARSKFWYFMKKLTKAKKTGGELLALNEIGEAHPLKPSNYGVWFRYQSRTDTHNMYKEFRDVTLTGAIGQLMQEMAGRHRALPESIQIIDTKELKADECKRAHVTQILKPNLRFPQINRIKPILPKLRRTFYCKPRSS